MWRKEQQATFDILKKSLTVAPVCAKPDFTKPFTIHTDASDHTVRAVLTQAATNGGPKSAADRGWGVLAVSPTQTLVYARSEA